MLSTKQRSCLAGMASTDAVVTHLGKGGPSAAFIQQLSALLAQHELIKVKFMDFKEEKKTIAADLAVSTKSELVRIIGNTAIFYKQNPDPEKRAIELD